MLQLEGKKKKNPMQQRRHSTVKNKKSMQTEFGRRKDEHTENCPLRTDFSVFQGV